MTRTFVEQRRADLHSRLAQVGRRLQGVEKHLRGDDGRLDADFGDRAGFTFADEVLEQLDEHGREEVRAIRVALDRIDRGGYGICESCGADIAEARLVALPTASLCVDCAG